MHQYKPSAPPMDNDYQWVDDNADQPKPPQNGQQPNPVYPVLPKPQPPPNNSYQPNLPQIQGYIQPQDMAIPDAISQQVIYQQIMAAKQQQKANNPQPPQVQHQRPHSFPNQAQRASSLKSGDPVSLKPNPSYMSSDLQHPDTSVFAESRLFVWRPKENGKGIEVMMGLDIEDNNLSFFGGKRHQTDRTAVDTAMRHFDEQVCNKLDSQTLQQIRRMLITEKDRRVFWKSEWRSVLFYYQMAYDYEMVHTYNQYKTWQAVMSELHWIDFAKLFKAICVTGQPLNISSNKNKYALQDHVISTLLHKENREYLLDLYIKNGGDANLVKPKYGGTVRPTLNKFKQMPSAIRLDIINPINHTILYNRWVETDISHIDDYQLLLSLISSICPEIAGNYVVYYTQNKSFKASKQQFVINSIARFNALRDKLNVKNNPELVTKLNILPTFIISDNFKGVSFAFKKKDVSWKQINASNDDEKASKSFVSGLVNKVNKFASGWFDNDDEEGEDDNKLEVDRLWKWQFMNDQNKFEDYSQDNTLYIECQFVSNINFIQIKRGNVPYQLNFKTMIQKNLNTSTIRVIRRVPWSVQSHHSVPKKMPVFKYNKWQFKDDNDQWIDYEKSVSIQLENLKKSMGAHSWRYGSYTMNCQMKSKSGTSYRYTLDVRNMRQTNDSTKKQRQIRFVAVYDDQAPQPQPVSYPFWAYSHEPEYEHKWQFKDNGWSQWKDYDLKSNRLIERKYITNIAHSPFIITASNKKGYKIHFNSMQQQCLSTGKWRQIRRQSLLKVNGNQSNKNKYEWQWQSDDMKWNKYDKSTSTQINKACNGGIKKYFFVSNKNQNQYEITFATMSQFNIQTGKQRKVRKVEIEPKWKGPGPNPKKFKGPKSNDRRTFDNGKCQYLYCVVGVNVADEVTKSGKFMRGTLGPFGCGLYFYDQIEMAKKMAKDRSESNKGYVIKAKVFIGKEHDVTNLDDKQFDFITLQRMSYDSVSRSVGFGKEFVAYNIDQICVEKVERYY